MMFSLIPQEEKFKFNSSFKLMVSCIFLQRGYKLKFHPFLQLDIHHLPDIPTILSFPLSQLALWPIGLLAR